MSDSDQSEIELDTYNLCWRCRQINFAAILTPREWDEATKQYRPVYCSEYTGNGKSPELNWVDAKKAKSPHFPHAYKARVCSVNFDELSESDDESLPPSRRPPRRARSDSEDYEDSDAEASEVEADLDAEGANSADEAEPADIQDEERSGSQIQSGLEDETGGVTDSRELIESVEQQLNPSSPQSESTAGPSNNNFNTNRSTIKPGTTESPPRIERVDNKVHQKQKNVEDIDTPAVFDDEQFRSHEFDNYHNTGLDSTHNDADHHEKDAKSEQDDKDDDHESGSSDDEDDSFYSVSTDRPFFRHWLRIGTIDLDEQAKGNWNYMDGQSYFLGSIWDLRSRRNRCDLCWKLWRHTRKNRVLESETITKSRCVMKLIELVNRRSDDPSRKVVMFNLVYAYGYKIDGYRDREWFFKIPLVFQGKHRDFDTIREDLSKNQGALFDERLYGEARRQQPECDYELFRAWLRTCETKHTHPKPSYSGDMNIRLIDVNRKCIIEWSGAVADSPRYVALSYVWGKCQQLLSLTSSNLDELKRPGSLDQHLNDTVLDAIQLVLRIGENYLWVDALCILQDSDEDKATQIPQMHHVYGRAILTIVAAYGNNADSGLPGVGLDTRYKQMFKLELADISVSIRSSIAFWAPPDGIGFRENYLHSALYRSRAWTFQEGYLSTRVLIFRKDTVFFECDRCTWCEETHWESDSIDFRTWRAIKDPVPDAVWRELFERRVYEFHPDGFQHHDSDLEDEAEPQRNSYASLIKEYTARSLTYNKDILSACTGVLNWIGERDETSFVFALRTKHFGNDLLFNFRIRCARRSLDQPSEELDFPTWSWLAWDGVIEVGNESRGSSYDLVEDLCPCDGVRCYTLEIDERGQKTLRVINADGGWHFKTGYIRRGEGIYDLTSFHRDTRVPDMERSDDDHQHHSKDDATIDKSAFADRQDSSGERQVEDLDQSDMVLKTSVTSTEIGEPAEAEIEQVQVDIDQAADVSMPQSNNATSFQELDIPEYQQELILSDIESHPGFLSLRPGFHIIFNTFASIVMVRTEYDEYSITMSRMITAGTRKSRTDGMSENKDLIQRKVFALRKVPVPVHDLHPASPVKDRSNKQKVRDKTAAKEQADDRTGEEEEEQEGGDDPDSEASSAPSDDEVYHNHLPFQLTLTCPGCHHEMSVAIKKQGLEEGAYLGRLPKLSSTSDQWGYMADIPDGVYLMLWMNNNQLPMFGHILCRPVDEQASRDGRWEGEILQRVSSVVGPTNILERAQQEKYATEWGTFILA